MQNQFKGFDLFNDIEDVALRNRNRAVVLANMADDHCKDRLISPKGAGLILGYFNQISNEDREDVKTRFKNDMESRGYVLARG